MMLRSRAARATTIALLAIAVATPALGQSAATPSTTVDTSPWLYVGSDIPHDPDWRFGKLPNGLRYAVRRNGVPPGQVAIRVRIDAGSLNERESERGYAHFIEHLSFRGSEYVPDGEAKRVWQRFGASFGTDQNAQTSPTQTVYKLDLPGATRDTVDQSLKILSGMMEKPNIVPAAIEAERPVVLAEQREAPAPQTRLSDARMAAFFAGQPLADRSPIGNIKTLEAATADSVLAFHDRWYRPENAVVVIAGDMDPDVLAQLVVKHFASWKGVGPHPTVPDFGKPDPRKPATSATVEPSIPTMVFAATLRPWRFNNDTIIFNQKRLVDLLAVQVINRRLERRARAGGSYLQAVVGLDDVLRSANITSVTIVPIGDNWEQALADVRGVIADALVLPPSRAEVDQELADYDEAMRTGADTARVEMGAHQADNMVEALDIRETTTTPRASYDVFLDARRKHMFTPAAILASTRRIFRGDASRALVNVHAADPTAAPKLAADLRAKVAPSTGVRAAQAAVDFSKLPPLGAPGVVTSDAAVPGLEMRQINFANGARLLIFPNSGETARVYVRVRWGGGFNALPADKHTPAWAGELALVASGVGALNQGDIDALTAGRRIGMQFETDDDAFSFSAITSAADLPDQLKLMADKLAAPGWDPAPVLRAKAAFLNGYPGYEASPDGVLSRDLEGLLHGGDPRWVTPSRDAASALTPEGFRALWEPILKSGPIEISVFGDVKPEDAIAAVARTFGALPPRVASAAVAPPPSFPAHDATPLVRTHSGDDNQAAAVIAWPTGGGADGIAESRRLEILAQVFSDRLFERLRQAAGASYSPNVASQWPLGLASGGRLLAIGQVTPDKVPFFFQIARQIAAELVSTPVGKDELQRILLPMIQQLARAATANQFWMRQLAGATTDERRVAAVRSLGQRLWRGHARAASADGGKISPARS